MIIWSELRTKVFRWNSSTDSRRRSLFLQFHFAHGSSLNIWNLFLMRILLRAIYISMPLTWKNRQNYPLVWLELSAIWQTGPGFNFHIYWKRLCHCVSSLLTSPRPTVNQYKCALCALCAFARLTFSNQSKQGFPSHALSASCHFTFTIIEFSFRWDIFPPSGHPPYRLLPQRDHGHRG